MTVTGLLRNLFLLLVFLLPVSRPYIFLAGGFPVQISDILFLCCFLLMVLAVVTRRMELRKDGIFLPLGIFAAALTVAAAFSEDPSTSLIKLVGEYYLFILFLLSMQLATDSRFRARIAVAWTGGALLTILGGVLGLGLFALGYTGQTDNFFLSHRGSLPPGEYPRLMSFFANTNMMANYLNASLGFIVIALSSERFTSRLRLVFTLGYLTNLLLTFSTGIGGVALTASLWLRDSLRRRERFTIATSTLIGGLLLASMMLVIAGISPKAIDLSGPTVGGATLQIQPSARLLIWKESLQTFWENPLTGKGLGLDTADVHYSGASGNQLNLRDAHNVLLNIAGQSGVIGLLSFLYLLLAVWRRMSFSSGPKGREVMILSVTLVGCLYYGGLTGSFENARHIWILLGIFAASTLRHDEGEDAALNS